MGAGDGRVEHGKDLDRLAQRRAQQLGDVGDGGVDVDMARMQRLAARKGEQVLDQLAAAFRGLVDQFCRLLQGGAIRQPRHQRLGGAGDDGQHVVEVVGDAAGELADGVELLRLMQLALGFAGGGDVVIDQRRAADRARGVAQWPARDDEMT